MDANEDGEARGKFGDAWRAQPPASSAKPYWDRIAQFRWGCWVTMAGYVVRIQYMTLAVMGVGACCVF